MMSAHSQALLKLRNSVLDVPQPFYTSDFYYNLGRMWTTYTLNRKHLQTYVSLLILKPNSGSAKWHLIFKISISETLDNISTFSILEGPFLTSVLDRRCSDLQGKSSLSGSQLWFFFKHPITQLGDKPDFCEDTASSMVPQNRTFFPSTVIWPGQANGCPAIQHFTASLVVK